MPLSATPLEVAMLPAPANANVAPASIKVAPVYRLPADSVRDPEPVSVSPPTPEIDPE